VALFGDGTAQTYETGILVNELHVLQENELLLVGPESQIEDLRKLSLD
jgi:hypothetical protein